MRENKILEKILDFGRKVIPKNLFKIAQPTYHFILAITGAILYGFPAKKLVVIGVTGTKGKSTTTEIVNKILEETGAKTALANTIRYKVGDKTWRNMFKMTLRGRFFTQRFLRQAIDSGCTHAIIEVSSEGVPQSRHKFLYLDALIFTNLAPEHIESHGSYENYVKAKLSIAREMEGRKGKFLKKATFLSEPVLVVNADDKEAEKFLKLNIKNKITYSLGDAVGVKADENGSSFQIGKVVIHTKLPGIFNVSNMLGVIALARFLNIPDETIKNALEKIDFIRGRMEKIENDLGIDIVVDYAHTPGSLRAVYETYRDRKTICILGNTGGGRDKWKREEMGKIADEYCDEIILTNEDPYDEDPMQIVLGIKEGIPSSAKAMAGEEKPKVEIIMDRREAISSAISRANTLRQAQGTSNDKIVILITGKGTDPYIMGPNGTKQEWDDATVAREELEKILGK